MNARLQPTVRCSFDSEESILRVMMPELNGTSPEEGALNSGDSTEIKESSSSKPGATEIVVYAMKVDSSLTLFFRTLISLIAVTAWTFLLETRIWRFCVFRDEEVWSEVLICLVFFFKNDRPAHFNDYDESCPDRRGQSYLYPSNYKPTSWTRYIYRG
jgi:hypothetical protein